MRDYDALQLGCSDSGLAVQSGLTGSVALLFPPFSGGIEFAIACGEDLLLATFELVLGRDVADGGVEADGVVVFDELAHDPPGVFRGQWRPRTDTLFLEDAMPTLDLAVALRVVG